MASSNNQKALLIGGGVILLLILWFIFFKKHRVTAEDFLDLTVDTTKGLPSCKMSTLPDVSAQISANMAGYLNSSATDPSVKLAYSSALRVYQSTLADYNNLTSCVGYCVGGSLNTTTGACICPADKPIPYNYNGNIYCIANDLSYVTDGSVIFDPKIPAFVCNPANYNVTGDNTCYNTSNKVTLQSAQQTISDAIAQVNRSPKSITSTYGQIGNFFIGGKMATDDTVSLGPTVGQATGVTSVVVAANGTDQNRVPANANFFVYSPQTATVSYYNLATPIGISSDMLKAGTTTIGSTKL